MPPSRLRASRMGLDQFSRSMTEARSWVRPSLSRRARSISTSRRMPPSSIARPNSSPSPRLWMFQVRRRQGLRWAASADADAQHRDRRRPRQGSHRPLLRTAFADGDQQVALQQVVAFLRAQYRFGVAPIVGDDGDLAALEQAGDQASHGALFACAFGRPNPGCQGPLQGVEVAQQGVHRALAHAALQSRDRRDLHAAALADLALGQADPGADLAEQLFDAGAVLRPPGRPPPSRSGRTRRSRAACPRGGVAPGAWDGPGCTPGARPGTAAGWPACSGAGPEPSPNGRWQAGPDRWPG